MGSLLLLLKGFGEVRQPYPESGKLLELIKTQLGTKIDSNLCRCAVQCGSRHRIVGLRTDVGQLGWTPLRHNRKRLPSCWLGRRNYYVTRNEDVISGKIVDSHQNSRGKHPILLARAMV